MATKPSECPQCGAKGKGNFLRAKDVDYPLQGDWGCKKCGYIENHDAVWRIIPLKDG